MAGGPFQVSASPPKEVLRHPLAWILWLLDVVVWAISIIGPIRWLLSFLSTPGSVRVGDAWRLSESRKALLSAPYPETQTVHEVIQRACATFPDRPACGSRKYLGDYKPDGAKFAFKKFGETRWINYREFGQQINCFGAGLMQLGLVPAPTHVDLQSAPGPHTIVIFEDTCVSWAVACLGAFTQSLAVATSYATLGINSVAEAVNETGAKAIVCNIKDVEKLAAFTGERCPSLEVIIYTTNYSLERAPTLPGGPGRARVISVEEVVQLGAGKLVQPTPPTSEHLAVIMYTSGSTGKPKGVMIKHSSAVASVGSIAHKFKSFGLLEGHETYVAYLPAAHILELVAELSMFSMGCAVGFACTKTISSKGACRVRPDGSLSTKPGYPYPPGAIQEFRPTLMAAVPKIWDILKKGVEEVLGSGSALKRLLFQVAYTGRLCALQQGRDSPLFKAVVFRTLSNMLGGRLKLGISGGGPISADVQNFIRTSFAIPLLQGYALTETTCAGTVQMLDDVRCGLVGPPLASVEMKLRSCVNEFGEPEVADRRQKPYLVTDTDHYGTPCMGRGEVLIRGPSVSSGYFRQPEKTHEAFDGEGWFHTGDVGLFTLDGALMLVDRVKNLVKLKGGEYIAIEAMEKEYSTSAYVNGVNGGIMCYGDGDMDRPVALVQVNTGEIAKLNTTNASKSVEDLCKDPAIVKVVLDSLLACGKAGDLCANELLCAIALIPGTGPSAGEPTTTSPWMPENGCLTASNKLNRKPILEAFAQLMEPLKVQGVR